MMDNQMIEVGESLEQIQLVNSSKVKPFSFLAGILFGATGANLNDLETLSLSFSAPLLALYPIIYASNAVSGDNVKDTTRNCNLCALNYSIGYGMGRSFDNIANYLAHTIVGI